MNYFQIYSQVNMLLGTTPICGLRFWMQVYAADNAVESICGRHFLILTFAASDAFEAFVETGNVFDKTVSERLRRFGLLCGYRNC